MDRIVVIEDDPAILRGLAITLRAESYEVLTAANGGDGYRIVCQKHPDLVILDLMLPVMSGYDICTEMRKHGMATPILMLTAQDQESDRIRGFEVGADDYVTKPFSVQEIIGRVRAILRRSAGRTDLATQRELERAHEIQQRLMPVEIPKVSGLCIAGTCLPARIVGGDYFDTLRLDNGAVAVCIADVCGKGLPAAMMMASLQAAVKMCASRQLRPRDLCDNVNRLMFQNLSGQGFITFFYAVIEPGSGHSWQFTYCNAGHNPPILAGSGGVRRLECGGAVLGVFGEWPYEEQALTVDFGDRILMYSDGITESRSPAGEEFGEERLTDLINRFQDDNATVLTERIVAAAAQFSHGNVQDDVTVLAVSVD
jgi:sigma-B regulation protein RsbU (phosphoserine phosphatase)